MAIQTKAVILDRLTVASAESPIVVFKSSLKDRYDAYFESTIVSKIMIKKYPDSLVGIFTKDDMAFFKQMG